MDKSLDKSGRREAKSDEEKRKTNPVESPGAKANTGSAEASRPPTVASA